MPDDNDYEESVQFLYKNIPEEGEERKIDGTAVITNNVLYSGYVNNDPEHVLFTEQEVNRHFIRTNDDMSLKDVCKSSLEEVDCVERIFSVYLGAAIRF